MTDTREKYRALDDDSQEAAKKMYDAFVSNDDDDLYNCDGNTHTFLARYSFESARMTINKLPKDAAIQVLEIWLRNNNG